MLDESICQFRCVGSFCNFLSVSDGESCEQTLQTLIRLHIVASDLGLNCLPMALPVNGFPGKNVFIKPLHAEIVFKAYATGKGLDRP